jgi:hypothetical protein
LTEFLSGYAVRRFHRPEETPGDPVPRDVFHCTLQRPIVNIVYGDTRAGKSFFADRFLSKPATKRYSTDVIVSRIANARYHHTPLEKTIRELCTPNDVSRVHQGIDERNLTEDFAAVLADLVARDDELVVIEGYLSEPVRKALSRRLSKFAIVWHTTRYET